MRIRYLFILGLIILLASCLGSGKSNLKPKHAPSSLIESFLVGKDSMLYFISLDKFINKTPKEEMIVDFTYLDIKPNPSNQIKMSFSIISNEHFKDLKKITLKSGAESYDASGLNFMFVEPVHKTKIKTRFHVMIPKTVLEKFAREEPFRVITDNSHEFISGRKWKSESSALKIMLLN